MWLLRQPENAASAQPKPSHAAARSFGGLADEIVKLAGKRDGFGFVGVDEIIGVGEVIGFLNIGTVKRSCPIQQPAF